MNRTLVLLLGLLVSSSVGADAAPGFGSPETVDNRIAEDRKNRDQPLKDQLAEDGVNLAVDYSAVGLGADNVPAGADDSSSGGMLRFYGSWDAINKGKNNAGGLVWKIEHRHAYSDTAVNEFEFGVGGLGLVTPPFSDQGTRLTNLYWKQRFNNGNGTLIAGFLDVTDYVDVYALASPWTGFMNFAFSTGTTTIALPGDATLGITGATMIGDQWFVIGGLTDMESDPTRPFDGFDTFFNEHKYFTSIEFGWTPSKEQIYVDNVHLTFWHADESVAQGSTKGSGVNFSASRMLGQWLPFVRGGVSEDAGTLTENSLSAGFAYYGLGRQTNNLGVAVNWADIDGSGDDQITIEAFYFMKVLGFLELTPDIQLIKNPALNPGEDQVTIYGLRGRILW